MTKNWINFRFLHICPVEKCEISPNLAKIHISPHLLCGKTEIPLHVEKFHVSKSEISPHNRFLLHLHVGDRGDKYEVWGKSVGGGMRCKCIHFSPLLFQYFLSFLLVVWSTVFLILLKARGRPREGITSS